MPFSGDTPSTEEVFEPVTIGVSLGLLVLLGIITIGMAYTWSTLAPAQQSALGDLILEWLANLEISSLKEQEKDAVIPKDNPKGDDVVIYRYGGTNPGNFVPSENDVITNTGLSFSTNPPRPGQQAAVTTIGALNSTGLVHAFQDRPGHVRVDPKFGTLSDWRDGGSSHPNTIAVKSVVVKWDGGN